MVLPVLPTTSIGDPVMMASVHFVAKQTCCILPVSSGGDRLMYQAIANASFNQASQLVAGMRESELVKCFQEHFEGVGKCCRSYLHLIAAVPESGEAIAFCRILMENVRNVLNRNYLLNLTTVKEVDMGGRLVQARMAAIHIAAYTGNHGLVRLLCQEYGVDANCNTSKTVEKKPRKGITALEWAARQGHAEVVWALVGSRADVNMGRLDDGVKALHV